MNRRDMVREGMIFAAGAGSAIGAARVRRALSRPGPPPPPAPGPALGRAVVVGNSLAAGPFAVELGRLLGPRWQVVGRGVAAQTTADMIPDGGEVDRLIAPGLDNVLVAWEGTNDLHRGADPADAAGRLLGYLLGRRRAGWRPVVLTLLPRTQPGTPPGFEAGRAAVNAAIRGGPFAVADVAAEPMLADPGDPRAYRDRVHLTAAGNAVAASRAAFAVMGG